MSRFTWETIEFLGQLMVKEIYGNWKLAKEIHILIM